MSEVLSTIRDRRSVRQFDGRKIEQPVLESIALAGRNAPTGMNKQTRLLTVVQRKDLIDRLCEAMGNAQDDTGYHMYHPDALIIVSEHRDESNGLANAACAMQNMMLAAHAQGVGSVWINQLKHVYDQPSVHAVLDELGIPESHKPWCNLALGYAAQQPEDKPKDAMTIDWFL